MRRLRRLGAKRIIHRLVLVASVVAAGCLQSTAQQPSAIQLNGTWKYTGVQTQPVRETLTGTLTISRESGTSFQGQLQLVATNEQSVQTVLAGLVSGSETNNSLIDFDADLETVRRHVGQIVADTITGNWISNTSSGTSSGTFRVERETQ